MKPFYKYFLFAFCDSSIFDDKNIIDCNYKDGTETITFEEIEISALSLDLTSLAAPKSTLTFVGVLFY